MTPEQTLLQTLQASSTVAGICSGRIYPDRAPEDALTPFAVFSRESTGSQQTLCAAVANPDVVFDLRCWADTRAQVEQLASACADACTDAGMGLQGREAGYSDDYALHGAILKVMLD